MTTVQGVDVIVLAGGLGTRLRSAIGEQQKVAALLAGRSMLDRILERLETENEVGRIFVCAGYDADRVRSQVDRRRGPAREVVVLTEDTPRGTGGALAFAMKWGASDPCLVVNGDSWFNAPLVPLLTLHAQRDSWATLAAAHVERTSQYGSLEINGNRVVKFGEKTEEQGAGWVNAGFSVLSHAAMSIAPKQPTFSLERDVLQQLPLGRVHAMKWSGPFLDVGTPERWELGCRFFDGLNERAWNSEIDLLVALDRDGTLIEEKHYLAEPEQVELVHGAAGAIKKLRAHHARVVMVTNQSGVARGFFDLRAVAAVNERVDLLLRREGARLDGVFVCPHGPNENCGCRKPAPGMVLHAVDSLGLREPDIWVVGDKATDVETAGSVGGRSILVGTGYGQTEQKNTQVNCDFMVPSIVEAVDLVCHAHAEASLVEAMQRATSTQSR